MENDRILWAIRIGFLFSILIEPAQWRLGLAVSVTNDMIFHTLGRVPGSFGTRLSQLLNCILREQEVRVLK